VWIVHAFLCVYVKPCQLVTRLCCFGGACSQCLGGPLLGYLEERAQAPLKHGCVCQFIGHRVSEGGNFMHYYIIIILL
jgi:hypothetical protein